MMRRLVGSMVQARLKLGFRFGVSKDELSIK